MNIRSLLCFVLSVSFASGAGKAPEWQAELTATVGKHPRLAHTVLDYQVSWNGMLNAGTLHIEIAPREPKQADTYLVRSSARTLGMTDKIFPHRHQLSSKLNPDTLRPSSFTSGSVDKQDRATLLNRYHADQVTSRETTTDITSGKITRKDRLFRFPGVHDLFSSMLFVRSLPLATGDKIALATLPFTTPLFIRIHVAAREAHHGRKAIKLVVSCSQIDPDTLALTPFSKLKHGASVWISDDADRIPLELRATCSLGQIRATLSRHEPGIRK